MFWKHFEFESLPSWSIDINKNGKQNTPFLLVDYSAWRAPRFSKRWTNMLAKTKCRWPRFGWRSVSFGKRVDDLCAQQKTSNMEMNPPRNLTGLYSETLLHTSFCCVFLYHASAKTLELPVSIQAAVQEVLEKIDQLQSSSSKATWGDRVTFRSRNFQRFIDDSWCEKFGEDFKCRKSGKVIRNSDMFFLKLPLRTSSWANVTDYRVDCKD